MNPCSYYKQYSLIGVKKHGRKPTKKDLPESFVDLMEKMGFEFSDYNEWINGCIGISRGCGTEYVARFDFKQGIFIAKEEERFGRIKTLGLEELPMRNMFFQIPDTHGGGQMRYASDVDERIPRFRDYLKESSFSINSTKDGLEVRKDFVREYCGCLWGGCIEVSPYEPYGEELVRLCKHYKKQPQ